MNILSMLAAENMFHFGSIYPSPILFGVVCYKFYSKFLSVIKAFDYNGEVSHLQKEAFEQQKSSESCVHPPQGSPSAMSLM